MRQGLKVSKTGGNDKWSFRAAKSGWIASSLALLAMTALSISRIMREEPMLPPLKPGITLAQPNGPAIETERLILRQWRGADIVPNTAMLSDAETARYITVDGKPITTDLAGWRNAAV